MIINHVDIILSLNDFMYICVLKSSCTEACSRTHRRAGGAGVQGSCLFYFCITTGKGAQGGYSCLFKFVSPLLSNTVSISGKTGGK